MRPYTVTASWDPEAGVWVAISENVPGLATEADTMEQLIGKLRVMVPELLVLNRCADEHGEVAVHIISERTESLAY